MESVIWNVIGYGAFIGIIVGVLFEKYRKPLFFIGPLLLVFYAGIFLQNSLLTSLQILIALSALFQLLNVPRRFSMAAIVILTVATCAFLVASGNLTDVWAFVGSLGLLSIAFGMIRLPELDGFLIMALGGLFMIVYAFAIATWVFFFLNIFFAVANVKTWRSLKKNTTARRREL